MNSQLINRLVLEAGEYANRVYTPPVRSKTPGIRWEPGHIAWYDIFHEKFAELIVRECAELIVKNSPRATCKEDFHLGYVSDGYMDAADLIENHFGVEE